MPQCPQCKKEIDSLMKSTETSIFTKVYLNEGKLVQNDIIKRDILLVSFHCPECFNTVLESGASDEQASEFLSGGK